MVVDVGLQPRLVRRAAAAAVDQGGLVVVTRRRGDTGSNQPGHVTVLLLVRAARGSAGCVHRLRDGVGHEHQVRTGPRIGGESGQRGQGVRDHRLDEAGMVEVVPDPVQLRRPLPHDVDGSCEVLAVLPATGVRRVGRGQQDDRSAHTGVGHLSNRVGQVGRPVAVAPVDRQVETARRELRLQRRDQRAVLRVDGAHAAEAEVVLADSEQTLARDVAAAGDVLEERQHVVGTLWPAEGDEQQGVVRRGVGAHGEHPPAFRSRVVGPLP